MDVRLAARARADFRVLADVGPVPDLRAVSYFHIVFNTDVAQGYHGSRGQRRRIYCSVRRHDDPVANRE